MGSNAAPSNSPNPPLGLPWFSTKGQIAQVGLAALACAFAGIKAWPEMKKSEFLSGGAVLFYVLVALVVTSVSVLIVAILKTRRATAAGERDLVRASPQSEVLPALFDPREHLQEDIFVTRILIVRDDSQGYPSKVYFEFINNTALCAEFSSSRWLSGIKAELLADALQLWMGYGWFPRPNGVAKLHVGPGERFRLWIAPDTQYNQQELQRLYDAKNLGTLMIRVNGKERGIIL